MTASSPNAASRSANRLLRISLLIVGASANATAADWPRWRGPDATGHVPAHTAVPTTLPTAPRYAWRTKIGAGLGSPVVSGGRVFYLDNQADKETAHAADAASGKVLWSVPLDDTFKDNQYDPGPRSTPLVDGDRVYVQSCRGEFRCLDILDGRTVWRVNFVQDFAAVFIGEKGTAAGASRHGYTGSAFIDGDNLLAAVGGREGASVVCFDKRDGRVRWKSQSDPAGYSGPIVASPAGIKQVIAHTVEGTIGLRYENGELLWRVPMKTSFGRHAATPLVFGDLVLVGSHQAGTIGLKISRQGDTCKASTAWREKRIAINFSSPVLVNGYLYGLGPAGEMFCADAVTGKEKWSVEISRGGNNAQAQFVVLGNNILALTDSGELILVAAEPKKARIVSRLQVAASTWCNPAYADGRLYLRDKDELLCVELMP